VRFGTVRGDAESFEGLESLDAVETFCEKNDIRLEGDDLFEAGVEAASYFGFFLGVGREIAEIGVGYEAVLQAEGVDRFGEARSERDDALHGLRDADSAARFINKFLVYRRCGRTCRSGLRVNGEGQGYRAEQKSSELSAYRSIFSRAGLLQQHKSPVARRISLDNKKAPRDTLGLLAALLLAKSAGRCGAGG